MPETTQFSDPGEENSHDSGGMLKPNTLLIGRYRILGVLGGGGMGTVYQARDMEFPNAKRLVAVKEMHTPHNKNRASTLATFRREADILASLTHPAIPRIEKFFDTEDRAYLIMEYINGSDLEVLLSKARELPVSKVIDWAIELCDVLEYLHRHTPNPIVFRDLKPANIMIDSFGKVRLIDFGIAKVFVDNKKHTMIGTEGYSAPEQYRGDVTPQSDIYGLGATLHHILTRKDPRLEPPFSFNERPIQEYNPNVPPELAAIVERAVKPNPVERFLSCSDMKQALEAIRYGSPAAPSVRTGEAATPTASSNVSVASNAPTATAPASGGPVLTDFFADLTEEGGVIEPRWKFTAEDEIRGGVVVHDDMVFFGSYDTNVWAISLATGEYRWKFATSGGVAATPVIDRSSRSLLVGSQDTTFYSLDYRNGRVNWTYITQGKIRGTARVAHDRVFFGSDDGKMYALMAANGRLLWEMDMGSPVRTRPFVTDELVIVGAEAGDMMGIELSGKRKWSFRVKRGLNSSPFVDLEENVCFIGGDDGFLYALDASSGYSLWRTRTGGMIVSSPISDGTNVYFGSTDGKFYAVNIESGKERWHFDTGAPIVGSPSIHGDAILIGQTKGALYCLNAKTGKEMWKYQAASAITGTPYVSDKMVVFGSLDKNVYALPLAF